MHQPCPTKVRLVYIASAGKATEQTALFSPRVGSIRCVLFLRQLWTLVSDDVESQIRVIENLPCTCHCRGRRRTLPLLILRPIAKEWTGNVDCRHHSDWIRMFSERAIRHQTQRPRRNQLLVILPNSKNHTPGKNPVLVFTQFQKLCPRKKTGDRKLLLYRQLGPH